MIKLMPFILFFLLVGCASVSKKAVGPCDKNAPLITTVKSSELKDRVLAAITQGDVQKTTTLASCNFIIEPGDSPDGAYYIRSAQAAPILIRKLKGHPWSGSLKDQNGLQHEVETADGKYVLFFRRTNRDEGPWYWAGYISLDTTDLDADTYMLPVSE